MTSPEPIRLADSAVRRLSAWWETALSDARGTGHAPEMPDPSAAREIARRLGAHVHDDRAEFGFWAPELRRVDLEPDTLELEILTPLQPIAWQQAERMRMRVDRIPVHVRGDFVWTAVTGVQAGTRESFGAFYGLRYRTRDGRRHLIRDPLAHSLPYGAHAPAELYDVRGLQHGRADEGFFQEHGVAGPHDDPPRFGPPANILQVHVGTATPGGTLGELADLYRSIGRKVQRGMPLSPGEQNFIGYDAVQLLPVEPVIEPGGGGGFFMVPEEELATAGEGREVTVELARPDMTNWGYDIVIAGSAAVSPTLLRSGRPDELRDLAEALHAFPGAPIRLIFDVVFGHSDSQGAKLLPAEFFAGPNMYGLDMNFRHPLVRAIMLEMQRRKVDFGADGVRVDGAQDFTYWDEDTETLHHDDDYLAEMSALVQQVAGVSYRPFMIFEDGRPWPREDWETASTYRAVIDQQPHAFQWGPLTFAHNTPCLAGFWNAKWWRIEEICRHGGHWVNGCANHDTLRRGYQIETDRKLNRRLGDTLPEILRVSYDHPAATLLTYGIFPGAPMEFIAATMRSPWAFVRNTDDAYGVKVVAEEAGFLSWRADPERFGRPESFPRMKALGFGELPALASFMSTLSDVVPGGAYDLERIAVAMRAAGFEELGRAGERLDAAALRRFARAFMDDLHAYCELQRYQDELNAAQTGFNLAVRRFRREHRWLQEDFGPRDRLERAVDRDGGTFATGFRVSPDGTESVLLLANLEGDPRAAGLGDTLRDAAYGRGWRVACASEDAPLEVGERVEPERVFELSNAQGVLLFRGS